MGEYEYSFKVSDLGFYVEYCEKNNYIKKEESLQEIILYKNANKIMARIITKEINGNRKIFLDFKDDDESDNVLKIRKESLPLELFDSNREAVDSILDILGYEKKKVLARKRIIYYKNEVVFELDNYISPEFMYVVGIEGRKEKVDDVYNELNKLSNIIKML